MTKTNRPMKDSGIEWIGEIPEDWKVIRLKAVLCERKEKNDPVQTDFVLSLGANYGIIPYAEKEGGGNKAKEDFTQYKLAYPNDIVMNSMNIVSGSVGLSKYFGCVSPVYYMFYPRNPDINIQYYHYMFQTKVFQRSLLGLGNGIMMKESNNGNLNTVRMRIPVEKLNSLILPVPSSDEQQKIAEFLDEKCSHIDSVLDKTKASIEEYKKLKQAVITQAVTKGIRSNRPMKDSEIEWIGEIPEDWRTVKLKYLSIEIGDGLHSTPNYDTEGNIYFINGNNIGAEALVFKSDTSRINEIEFAKYKQPIMNENTILITLNGATYGKTSYYNNEKILLGKSAGYITLKCKESKQFLRYYLQSTIAKTIMDLSLNGTTIANLSLTTLNNFLIIYPSIVEQQEIVSYLNAKCAEIDKLIEKKEQLISELETYKKSLIYEYVTGKKEVC